MNRKDRLLTACFLAMTLFVGGVAGASAAPVRRSTSVRGTARVKKAALGAKLKAERALAEATALAAEAKPVATPALVEEAVPAESVAKISAIQATRTGRIARAIGNAASKVFHPILTIKAAATKTKAFFAEVRENRAARRDFKAWLEHEDNREIATYRKGARSDASVGWSKARYVLHIAGAAAHLSMMNTSIALGLAPVAAMNAMGYVLHLGFMSGAAEDWTKGVKTANDRTIEFALDNQERSIDQRRLESWAKAGIISKAMTLKPAELEVARQVAAMNAPEAAAE